MPHYPTAGAREVAETGRTARQRVLDEANIPAEDRIAVSLYANFIANTSPGYRPSDAAREAVRRYRIDPGSVHRSRRYDRA